jgi:hypothetical protein
VWSYREPYEFVADIAGHVAFYTDQVESSSRPDPPKRARSTLMPMSDVYASQPNGLRRVAARGYERSARPRALAARRLMMFPQSEVLCHTRDWFFELS